MRDIPDVYVDILGVPGDGDEIDGLGAIGDERNRIEPGRLHSSVMVAFAKTEIYSYVLSAGQRGLSCEEIGEDLQEVAGRWLDNVSVSCSSEFWSFIVAGDFVRRKLEARDYESYQAALRSLYSDLYAEQPAS